MFGTLIRRSLRARLGRNIVIGLTILVSVAFVAGSFILTDSMKASFDNLFNQLSEGVDLEVRSQLTVDDPNAVRDPVPASLVAEVASVPGVGQAIGTLSRYAQVIDTDGKPVSTQGAPALGVSWSGPDQLGGTELRDGEAPRGIDQVAIDKATADNAGYKIGDTVSIVFDDGQREFTLVGLVGIGDTDSFGGASVSLFDPETAAEVLNAPDQFDAIEIAIAPDADIGTVQRAVKQVLPERTEVVTGQDVADETADGINQIISLFGTGLLVFAFVTAFVSSFIISNVFGITIGQRLRELALLRAIGADAQQVRRLVIVEGLVISVISTAIGILGGVVVAQMLIYGFNAAGAGFPEMSTVMSWRTVIVGSIVGIGVTMLSVLVPARRASRVPPVAAMQPEAGFSAISASRRMVGATIATVGGIVLFLIGLFVRPGGSIGLAVGAGLGAVAIFLGVSSLASLVAKPVTGFIGAPIRRFFGVAGNLAVDNAGRSPRRTARTSSALMIGLAMMSAAAVFASSLSATISGVLDRALTADYIVSDDSFLGLPPGVASLLAEQPEIQAVSPFRFIAGEVGDEQIQIAAIDPVPFPDLVNLDITSGGYDGLLSGDGVLIYTDVAEKLGVGVGDQVKIAYQNGVSLEQPVSGIFADNAIGADWYISIDTVSSVSSQVVRDQIVLARLAEGVDPVAADKSIQAALVEFPQAQVQSNAEYRATIEGQINQLLTIIVMLLSMSMAIAVIGIALTLALSVFERTREIGLLRAVGTTRRQLRRSIRWEAIIVSVFGAVVGVIVGGALGTALTIAVPDNVIDTVSFPLMLIVGVLIGSIVAGVFAAWYPARKAAKMDVLAAVTSQ